MRHRAGLFDVSHMGEIEIEGPAALELVLGVATNDARRLRDGRVQYSLLCSPQGGILDDVTVHRLSGERFFLCVNAANTERDFAWIRRHAPRDAEVRDASAEFVQLALQGPAATEILSSSVPLDLRSVGRFAFVEARILDMPVLLARTGYTGEDGWEIYLRAPGLGERLWAALLDAGRSWGLVPAGLGARDTLRIEAALPLYGHEIDESTTPWEAGLGRFVDLGHAFVGREALERQLREGVPRRLVGLEVRGNALARPGNEIFAGERAVGHVTSGTFSYSLGKPVALGYVRPEFAEAGRPLAIGIRGRRVAAEVVPLPFYRRR